MIRCITLFLLLLFFINSELHAELVTKSIVKSDYYINKKKYSLIDIKVHNNTDENVLLWLEQDTIIQKKRIEDKIKNYFVKNKGDFSLLNMIYDYGSTFESAYTEIFSTFYKALAPKEIFHIIFLFDYSFPNDNIDKLLLEQIIVVKETELKSKRINYIDFKSLFIMSYQGTSIVIPTKE